MDAKYGTLVISLFIALQLSKYAKIDLKLKIRKVQEPTGRITFMVSRHMRIAPQLKKAEPKSEGQMLRAFTRCALTCALLLARQPLSPA